MLFGKITQILHLTSATSPALVQAALHADPAQGGGVGYGRPPHQQFFVQAVRAQASNMTGVVFQVQGARDPAAPVWIPILCKRLGDAMAVFAQTQTVSVNAGSTNEEVLITTDADGIPVIRVLAQAVGADAGSGDSATAWTWL